MKIKKIIGSTIAAVMMLTCVMTMLPAMLASADSDNSENSNLSNEYILLSDFVKENKAAENIFLADTVPPLIIIEMYTDYRTDERRKLIKDFMDQNGINDSDVMIEQYDFGWELGDANLDSTVNVRDCALIASSIASGKSDSLPHTADYNRDGKKNVRDAAAISKDLASK